MNPENRFYDAIVLGAGPAGSVAAGVMAARGLDVLLVDKDAFPRFKVCGCCVNDRCNALLDRIGWGRVLCDCNAVPLRSFLMGAKKRQARLPLPGGVSVSRDALDAALVKEAQRHGVTFASSTVGEPVSRDNGCWRISLKPRNQASTMATTRVLVIAAGVAPPEARRAGVVYHVRKDSTIGVGARVVSAPDSYEPHTIYMAVGKQGYVGAVRLEDGSLNFAAAVGPDALKTASVEDVIRDVLQQGGFDAPDVSRLIWRGTRPLTQRPDLVAYQGLFLVGDAAGYVEPFTGEGISWALGGAVALADVVAGGLANDPEAMESQWVDAHRRLIRRRQWTCRAFSRLLRSPWTMSAVTALLQHAPSLASPVVRTLVRRESETVVTNS